MVVGAALVSPLVSVAHDTAGDMTRAASALRDSLSADHRETADYAFEDEERRDLRLAPFLLEGLEMNVMSAPSKAHLGDLLSASLGPVGRRKADQIRGLELEVIRQEAWYQALFTAALGIRGDEAYFLSVYGAPGAGRPWGYRFDGHHLSVNMTVVGDDVSATPLFLGAQPRTIPEGGVGGPVGLRVLAEEEDRARALYESLDASQRSRATLELELGRGLFVGAGERVEPDLSPPVGLSAADLTTEQRELLDELLEVYLQNVADPVAARERAKIDAAGRDAIHFAWAGPTTPGEEMYYRIHGPTVLIEFDDTVGGEHIHALWRDPSGDFGEDLLRQHYEAAHGSN